MGARIDIFKSFYQWSCRQGLHGFDSPAAEWHPRPYQRRHQIEIVSKFVKKKNCLLNSIQPIVHANEGPVFQGQCE